MNFFLGNYEETQNRLIEITQKWTISYYNQEKLSGINGNTIKQIG